MNSNFGLAGKKALADQLAMLNSESMIVTEEVAAVADDCRRSTVQGIDRRH